MLEPGRYKSNHYIVTIEYKITTENHITIPTELAKVAPSPGKL